MIGMRFWGGVGWGEMRGVGGRFCVLRRWGWGWGWGGGVWVAWFLKIMVIYRKKPRKEQIGVERTEGKKREGWDFLLSSVILSNALFSTFSRLSNSSVSCLYLHLQPPNHHNSYTNFPLTNPQNCSTTPFPAPPLTTKYLLPSTSGSHSPRFPPNTIPPASSTITHPAATSHAQHPPSQ